MDCRAVVTPVESPSRESSVISRFVGVRFDVNVVFCSLVLLVFGLLMEMRVLQARTVPEGKAPANFASRIIASGNENPLFMLIVFKPSDNVTDLYWSVKCDHFVRGTKTEWPVVCASLLEM